MHRGLKKESQFMSILQPFLEQIDYRTIIKIKLHD